ncbi:MAG: phosphoesterase [Thermoplasmata archaeon HGW-Thermoplasmata-1]|nr:MAG: phosphoesterase [Thermoplasmata archaeon HGW-Thermoplasmata-1]
MKSIIFSHGDSDGVCAAAIAKAALPDARLFFTNPVGLVGDLREAGEYGRIVLLDLAIDERSGGEICDILEGLQKSHELLWIDHHPVPDSCSRYLKEEWFVNDESASTSELAYRHFKSRVNRDLTRVAIIGALGDYEINTGMIAKWAAEWDIRSLSFQAGALIGAIFDAGRDYGYKRSLAEYLSQDLLPSNNREIMSRAIASAELEEKMRLDIKKTVKSMRNLGYYVNPSGYMSKAAIYSQIYSGKLVGAAAEYRGQKNVYDISVRASQSFGGNLDPILREVAVRHDGSGGGHRLAGGARVPANAFEGFLSDLDERLGALKN